jgi:tripartite-type tricarboxylate transporter receptor subunit TctC
MNRRNALIFAAVAACSTAAFSAYPEHTVKLVVPFPPGQATDTFARVFAVKLAQVLKQPVIVENRAGAGGTIGADYVTHATPDGYTLLMGASAMAIDQTLYKNLRYDVRKDLEPISPMFSVPLVILANDQSGIHTFAEFIKRAKDKPGSLNFASAGIGGAQHLAMEMVQAQAGISLVHIAYKGSAPAQNDFLGNQVPLMVDSVTSALPFIKSGKAIALAVTSSSRMTQLPQVPTVAESGLKGFEAIGWAALWAPKGTPSAIVDELNAQSRSILASPEVQAWLTANGAQPIPKSRADAQSFVADEVDKWGAAVTRSGAVVE